MRIYGLRGPVGVQISSAELAAPQYEQLVDQIKDIVRTALPADGTVAVVSKGDDTLLQLDGRRAWHFPCDVDGVYSGAYPADGAAAIAQFEELRATGAEYVIFPSTAFWWFEHYPELERHLTTRYPLVADREACRIFQLQQWSEALSALRAAEPVPLVPLAEALNEIVDGLLPPPAIAAVVRVGEEGIPIRHQPWDVPRGAVAPGTLIAHVGALRAAGVEFLIVPRTAYNWLGGQPELLRHLRTRHRLVMSQAQVGEIYELEASAPAPAPADAAASAAHSE